jgi:hypothetical protein
MRSSVLKSARQGARGQQKPIIGLKKAPQTNTHQRVGDDLTSSRL